MNVNDSTNAPQSFAPKGLQQTSPGQRPGFVVPQFFPSPERAKQGDAICAALSGLDRFFAMLSQGVALGWFVGAPSGRLNLRPQISLRCSIRLAFVALFVFVSIVRVFGSRPVVASDSTYPASIGTFFHQHTPV